MIKQCARDKTMRANIKINTALSVCTVGGIHDI